MLVEAKQSVPSFIKTIPDPMEDIMKKINQDENYDEEVKGCRYCGGLGHRVSMCPKLEREKRERMGAITSKKDLGSLDY